MLIYQVISYCGGIENRWKIVEISKNHQNFQKFSAEVSGVKTLQYSYFPTRMFWYCKFNLAWSKALLIRFGHYHLYKFTDLCTSGYIVNFFVGIKSTRTICRTNVIPISKQVCIFFIKNWLVFDRLRAFFKFRQ